MAYSHSKLMGFPLPLVSGEKDLLGNPPVIVVTKTRALPIQVRMEGEQKLHKPKTKSVSRRDTMLYMTAEILSGVALFSAEPAEARVGRLENKRKVMEKLEKLREKAGVSKPKPENGIETPRAPKRPMNTQQGSAGPVVEAILPA